MIEQVALAAAPGIMSLIGEAIAAGDDARAEELRRAAMQEYNIELPPLEAIKANELQSQAAQAQGSAEAKSRRLAALRMLEQKGLEGYTAEDKAAVNDLLSDVGAAERGRREAFMSRLNPNSGAAVAAQLSSQQHAAQQANRRGLDLAAQSRRQALQALAQTGSLAGQIDESEFGQALQRGQAQDAIGRFNEANRIDVLSGNRAAGMQRAGMQMQLADRRAGVLADRTAALERQGNKKRRIFGGIGQSIQQGGLGYMQAK